MVMQLFTRNSEVKLVEALNSVNDPSGWHAVHFHLSELMEQFKSEYQVKIAVNLVNDLLKNFDGGIFVLQDSSIIVVCYGLEKAIQNKLVFQLRYLYMDDPIAYFEDGQENPAFYSAYDLKQDWQAFSDLSSRRMALTVRRASSPRTEKIAQIVAEHTRPKTEPHDIAIKSLSSSGFSASRLASLEQDLKQVGIAKVIRRQPICAMQQGLPPRKVFDELYVHMSQLREVMHADVDFLSNRWLFRYLTQLLDVRMLAFLISERSQYLNGPISLNINVETLLSQKFQEFDAALPAASKVGVVLEVPLVDAFADMAGFHVARKEMQALGYRVCLDGLTVDSFNHVQRERLGVDLVKVQWHANMNSDLMSQESKDMAAAIKVTGSNRVILCRCDNKQAVEFGQSLGVSLFQGRFVDGVINPSEVSQN